MNKDLRIQQLEEENRRLRSAVNSLLEEKMKVKNNSERILAFDKVLKSLSDEVE